MYLRFGHFGPIQRCEGQRALRGWSAKMVPVVKDEQGVMEPALGPGRLFLAMAVWGASSLGLRILTRQLVSLQSVRMSVLRGFQ